MTSALSSRSGTLASSKSKSAAPRLPFLRAAPSRTTRPGGTIAMASTSTLRDLLELELQDTYDAEKQLVSALPKMAKAASNPELRAGFEQHLAETKTQVGRLEQVARELDISLKGNSCEGMEGLIEEGEEIIDLNADDVVRDAGLIAAAQKVEHYEIAAYGTLCA